MFQYLPDKSLSNPMCFYSQCAPLTPADNRCFQSTSKLHTILQADNNVRKKVTQFL